ncbi:hypothetical protein PQX77_015632 [Marasmius sp. AFHP31]|nr:hypothetical protein PQX77_015632 [Marasmius sp. AFHP31]
MDKYPDSRLAKLCKNLYIPDRKVCYKPGVGVTLSNIEDVNGLVGDEMVVSDQVKTLSMKRLKFNVLLIEYLTFPRLLSINIESSAVNATHLDSFIRRSYCSVTSLRLDLIPNLSDFDFIRLLCLMSELRKLDVRGDVVNNLAVTCRFFDPLTVNPDDLNGPFLLHLVDLQPNTG